MLKQPKQFYLLSSIELWERFGFYAMQSLLTVFLVKQLHFSDYLADETFGAFTALIYAFVCAGGWAGDKLIGSRRTMLLGAIVLMSGYGLLSIDCNTFIYPALGVIIAGNALFKANPAALLEKLYKKGDNRIDSAFTLYYMAINVGSLISMLISPVIQKHFGWNWAFSVSFAGMLIAIINNIVWRRLLEKVGSEPDFDPVSKPKYASVILMAVAISIASAILLKHLTVAHILLYLATAVIILLFIRESLKANKGERMRLIVCIILIVEASLFFIMYQQMPTSLNLFTMRNTTQTLFGIKIEPESFMALNPFWIMILSPLLAIAYNLLSKNNRDLSISMKFAVGMLLTSCGFLVLAGSSKYFANANGLISGNWLILSYFLQSTGELLISGLGLAMISRLAPKRCMAFMMGVWFLSQSLSGSLGGTLATVASIPDQNTPPVQSLPIYSDLFLKIGLASLAIAMVMFFMSPFLNKAIEKSHRLEMD